MAGEDDDLLAQIDELVAVSATTPSLVEYARTQDELDDLRYEIVQPSRPEDDEEALIELSILDALDLLQPPDAVYRHEPTRWVEDQLEYHLWSKQRQIIESVRDHRQTAVHSAHAIGKSLTAACTAVWWITTHEVGDAFVITTAPTHAQVQAILWREMNRLHVRGRLGGRMNLLEWYFGNELVAFGRKPADYDPAAFQGIHARYVLCVFDEACGIPKPLWDAASTLIANADSRFLAIGNPDDPHGEFARVCRPNSGWSVIHVGATDTPNFTGEEVDERVAASLISPEWVDEKKKAWGLGSALYTSKVEGLFPTDSDKGVVPLSWAIKCRYLELPEVGPRCAGLDVGGGGDLTVLRERIGAKVGRELTWNESDPMKLVGDIALTLEEWGVERVVIDSIGIGWGLAGRLKELSRAHEPTSRLTTHGAFVIPFNASEASNQPERFINKRAELHWEVGRELTRELRWDLEHVDDDTLAELTEAQYEIMDSRGKVKVELKAQVKARLGRSPDRADALLMAFWEGDSVQANIAANARILSQRYDSRVADLPDWAGPNRGPATPAEATPERLEEDRVLQELWHGRPV